MRKLVLLLAYGAELFNTGATQVTVAYGSGFSNTGAAQVIDRDRDCDLSLLAYGAEFFNTGAAQVTGRKQIVAMNQERHEGQWSRGAEVAM